MEHPYLFFVKLFEWIGLDHFAHAYPHVIYSWVVMALLIFFGALAAKKLKLVPAGAQNFFEIIVSGIEEFMVDITGDEGRWFFPVVATIFIYILACNLVGLVPGFFPPTASLKANPTKKLSTTTAPARPHAGPTSPSKAAASPPWPRRSRPRGLRSSTASVSRSRLDSSTSTPMWIEACTFLKIGPASTI